MLSLDRSRSLIRGFQGRAQCPRTLDGGRVTASVQLTIVADSEVARYGAASETASASATPSPQIGLSDLVNKTRAEIRQLAADRGLVPSGQPDPQDGMIR